MLLKLRLCHPVKPQLIMVSHFRCVLSTVQISWSTSVDTAVLLPSISVSAQHTFVILVIMISSG